MAFKVIRNNNQQSESDTPRQEVDWEAYHNYMVKTADLEEPTVLTGYVSVIADLGLQKMEPGKIEWNGTPEQEAEELEKRPDNWFEDGVDHKGNKKRYRMWNQKDTQCVALAVDIPDIMVNKGQFFGDDTAGEKPVRLWLGGDFFTKESGMIVARPIPLKHRNIADSGKAVWSLDKKHSLYKMASAAKLLDSQSAFTADRIDELLGKSFQFECQIFMKEGKNGKKYYTENIKFTGGLARGQKPCTDLPTTPYLIQFDDNNDSEALKELRSHVVNTMKRASNWEESIIKKELEAVRPSQDNSPAKEESPKKDTKPPKQEKPNKPVVNQNEDVDSSDCPF